MPGRAVRKRIRLLEYNGRSSSTNKKGTLILYTAPLRAGPAYDLVYIFIIISSADIIQWSIESTIGRAGHSNVASFINGQNRCLSTHFTFCRTLAPSFVAVYTTAHYVHVCILTKYILSYIRKNIRVSDSICLCVCVCIQGRELETGCCWSGEKEKKGDERDKNTTQEKRRGSPPLKAVL